MTNSTNLLIENKQTQDEDLVLPWQSIQKPSLIQRFLRKIFGFIFKKTLAEIVPPIIQGMVRLELANGEYIKLAPAFGMYGIKISGGLRPYFRYDFHNGTEWVNVFVVLSMNSSGIPKMASSAQIDGEATSIKPEYLKPFYFLASKLSDYFPFDATEGVPNMIRFTP